MAKILTLLVLILLVACTTTDPDATEEVPFEGPTTVDTPAVPTEESTGTPGLKRDNDSRDEATPDRATRMKATEVPEELERVPELDAGQAVVGEVPPEIMAAIMADVQERTGAGDGEIAVLRAEEAIWNDGSLGCPKPGEMYTQALVHGYWVQLAAGAETYDYRVNDRGLFFLCESPLPGNSGAPTG